MSRTRYKFRSKEDKKVDGSWRITWPFFSEETGYSETILSLSGGRWADMNSRCKLGGSQQYNYPRYVGIQNNFDSFDRFVEWSITQFGYKEFQQVNGKLTPWQLDKDIIGLNYYGEDSCLFVPQEINKFFTYKQNRGSLLTGVRQLPSGSYEARISIEGKHKYLGVYKTEHAAHMEWCKVKSQKALEYAERFESIGHDKLAKYLFIAANKLSKGVL